MMVRRFAWCALMATLGLAAAPLTRDLEAKSNRRHRTPFALRAHVVDFEAESHPTRRARQRSFEGYETHTIEFDVFRRSRSELERPTQVKLYLPNGDLYSAVDVVPFEHQAAPRRRRSRAPTATARVRVSGTAITRFGLYGEWRADVCWDSGSETSCRRALSFDIH